VKARRYPDVDRIVSPTWHQWRERARRSAALALAAIGGGIAALVFASLAGWLGPRP
jgi:hypothetical protein